MNSKFKTVATAILAVGLAASFANASDKDPAAKPKKHATAAEGKKPTCDACDQIQALKTEMQGQIDAMKQEIASKDAALAAAQKAAADAQAAADRANAAVSAQNQAATDNAAAVTTLQTSVTDLKANAVSLATTVSDETAAIKKSINSPEGINYKGITISPAGSFIAAETVDRTSATGGGLNTPYTGVPLEHSDLHNMSEFFGSGRQSRLAIKAVGKLENMTLTGYYEMDWLGTGITSNNNQSNSYVLRQRQIWAEAAMKSGWTVSAGQMWSLATETTKGTSNGSEILPGTIDPQYTAGFNWARQYGFRVSAKLAKGAWLAASAENAETLNPAGTINLNSGTTILLGSGGVGGGLYNSTANYSFNLTPDFVVKAVFEPGWGHWEVFGIERNFRDRIYVTGSSPTNNTEIGGGIGGGFRAPLANKKLSIGVKGLWGYGVGRYGNATIADVTIKPNGVIEPLEGFSALSTLEASPTKRLSLYMNYGGDYIYRDLIASNDGYGLTTASMSGCNTEVAASTTYSNSGTGFGNGANPASCSGNNKDVQEATFGYWYNFYNGPKGRLRQGIQYSYIRRDLWSGNGGTTNPGGGAHGDDNLIYTSLRYYLP